MCIRVFHAPCAAAIDKRYQAQLGRFGKVSSQAIDEVRNFLVPHFHEALSARTSLHVYIEDLPGRS